MNTTNQSITFDTKTLTENELFDRIRFDSCLEYILNDEGSPTEFVSDDGAVYLSNCRYLDRKVREIASAKESAFTYETILNKEVAKITTTGNIVIEAYSDASKLSGVYVHSPHIELFLESLWSIGIRRSDLEFSPFRVLANSMGMLDHQLAEKILSAIRINAKSSRFRRKLSLAKEKISRRMIDAETYLNRIFLGRSKVLAIRVDLAYKKNSDHDLNLERIKRDLKRLLDNRRQNRTIFKHMIGYIWKIESGIERGLHLHCIFLFNGQRVNADSYYANLIGHYWRETIVKVGEGVFYNCNSNKQKYDQVGIGMILRSDLEKRDILLNRVISYLAKSDTIISAKVLCCQKCFGVGN